MGDNPMEYQDGRAPVAPVRGRPRKKVDKEPQVGSKRPLTSRAAAVRARTKLQKARQLVNGIKCPEKTELFDLLYDAETCLNRSLSDVVPRRTPIRL